MFPLRRLFLLVLLALATAACHRAPSPPVAAPPKAPPGTLHLSAEQAKSVDTLVVGEAGFQPKREAVGYIDFDPSQTVAVTSQWTGRVRQVFVQPNQPVAKGTPLFSIDSTDLAQAESNAIATAGVLQNQNRALQRARAVYETAGGPRKDVDQATADQQSAEANARAARDTLRVFGKSPGEIRRLAGSRQVTGVLVVTSPQSGIVVSRNLAPGVVVQPGMSPAPVTISDMSTVTMVGSVAEGDIALIRAGQPVGVYVDAYPDQRFKGSIDSIAASADPATHRIMVRMRVADPRHLLRAQMLATAEIPVDAGNSKVAVPVDAVVRESQGAMTVYVTTDGQRFTRRVVRVGDQEEGNYPVLEGLRPGERIANKSALFIANAMALQPQ